MSIDYDGMKNYELYLLTNKPGHYKEQLGEREYFRKLKELQGDDTSTVSQSLWNKNRTPAASANSAKLDNMFYANAER